MKKNIFSKILVAAAMLLSATALTSCDALANLDNGTFLGDMVISGPGVANHEATLEMESTLQLKCAEMFSGMNEVRWRTADPNIAKVDETSGLVTPVAPGIVRIDAYTDTENVRQGDYVMVTVVGKSLSVIDDGLDQSLAD